MSEIISRMRNILSSVAETNRTPDEWVLGRSAYSEFRRQVDALLTRPLVARKSATVLGITIRESPWVPPWHLAAMKDGQIVGVINMDHTTPPAATPCKADAPTGQTPLP